MESVANYLCRSREVIDETIKRSDLVQVDVAARMISKAAISRLPIMVCGNGGSASDAMHIAGELVGRFRRERGPIHCVALTSDSVILTAWANDYDFEGVFARQVQAYGRQGGILIGLSTSGNSGNVVRAFEVAASLEIATIAMTGEGGGKLADLADVLIAVPSTTTALIQQVHICLYHYICERVEEAVSETDIGPISKA